MRLQSDVCLDFHHLKAWLDLEGLHWAPHVAAKIVLAGGGLSTSVGLSSGLLEHH